MNVDTILLGITLVFGFYMAWNIGANDVANAMGTSVGSKALTLKQAVILAAILEFAGAFLVGANVTDTVRKGMFDPQLFNDDIYSLVYGMMAALLAAGIWLNIATYFGWPVSTTHSIVGAVIGFVLIVQGAAAIEWAKVSEIVASWFISPVMSGTISFVIFSLIRKFIFQSKDKVKAVKRAAPFIVFIVIVVLSLVLVYKGLKNLNLDLNFIEAMTAASIAGIICAIVSIFLVKRFKFIPKYNDLEDESEPLAKKEALVAELTSVTKNLDNLTVDPTSDLIKSRINTIESEIKDLIKEVEEDVDASGSMGDSDYGTQYVEKIFVGLQILSACFVAFAHGSNDVANAIGPIAAVVDIIQTKSVSMSVAVPLWILGLGGIGIVIGLATWGYKVIFTIGEKITELTPSRGFSAEFGAAITIVIASRMGLPISTTHTLVGAVLGVGLARGVKSLDLKVVRDIMASWFITLPVSAILSIVIYYVLKFTFG